MTRPYRASTVLSKTSRIPSEAFPSGRTPEVLGADSPSANKFASSLAGDAGLEFKKAAELRRDNVDQKKTKVDSKIVESVKKKRIEDTDGQPTYLVDGGTIRDKIDVDFALGGNSARYSYIPEGEIWVEHTGDKPDVKNIAKHEGQEEGLMRQGQTYDQAHDAASKEEEGRRKQAAELKSKLLPHQQRVIDRMKQQEGLVVAHGTGSGKTLTSLGAIVDLNPNSARVIVPASLQENYKKEIAKHVKGKLPIKVESLQKAIKDGNIPRGDIMVIDEAHRIRNPQSQGYQLARASEASKRMLLTASPVYNRPEDIAPLVNVAAGQKALPEGSDFNQRYIKKPGKGLLTLINPWAQKEPKIVRPRELGSILNQWVDYHSGSEEGFPSLTEKRINVNMSPRQSQLHADAWGELPLMMRWRLKKGLPPDKQDLARLNKFQAQTRQISSSEKKYVQGDVKPETSPKVMNAVVRLQKKMEANPEHKALVYANFLGTLDDYASQLEQRKIPYSVFRGDTSKRVRDQAVRDYNEGKVKALLVSGAGGEGLDLKGTRQVQVLEPHWNEEKLDQVIGRARRFGSHDHLPVDQRNVEVERYSSQPTGWLGRPKRGIEDILYDTAAQKQKLNDQVLNLLTQVPNSGVVKSSSEIVKEAADIVRLEGDNAIIFGQQYPDATRIRGGEVFAAQEDGKTVGGIVTTPKVRGYMTKVVQEEMPGREPKREVSFFYVDPEKRGQGLGRQLLSEALQGNGDVVLSTDNSRVNTDPSAVRLYEKAGFEPVRREDNSTYWIKKQAAAGDDSVAAMKKSILRPVRAKVGRDVYVVTHHGWYPDGPGLSVQKNGVEVNPHEDQVAGGLAHATMWQARQLLAKNAPARLKAQQQVKYAAEALRPGPGEFAPGIPGERGIRQIPKVKPYAPNQEWMASLSMHPASRRGDHHDLRLVDPKGRAHSWAFQDVPVPGKSTYAVQQPTHKKEYALRTEPFTIPQGYGATRPDAQVQPKFVSGVEIVEADNKKIRFLKHDGQQTQEFVLRNLAPAMGTVKPMWALHNATKTRNTGEGQKIPSYKPKFTDTAPNKVDVNDQTQVMSPKIDGAHVLVSLPGEGERFARVYSYRPTNRETGLIEHTFKFPDFQKHRGTPEVKNTMIRAEAWATDRTGKAIPAEQLGGLLNAGVLKSRQKQEELGIKLRLTGTDVVRHAGKNYENKPFAEKIDVLNRVNKATRGFIEVPEFAVTPEHKQRMLEQIRNKQRKDTEEGVVLQNLTSPTAPIKSKFRPDQDVYVKEIFNKPAGKAKGWAGGFAYSLDPEGPVVGRVGTGFSAEMRKDMLSNPDKYIGRVAKVESTRTGRVENLPGKALRAPAFKNWHLDKTDPVLMQEDVALLKKQGQLQQLRAAPIVEAVDYVAKSEAMDRIRNAWEQLQGKLEPQELLDTASENSQKVRTLRPIIEGAEEFVRGKEATNARLDS